MSCLGKRMCIMTWGKTGFTAIRADCWALSGKVKEVEKAELHAWTLSLAATLTWQLTKAHAISISFSFFSRDSESTEAATQARTHNFSSYPLLASVSWALCHVWMDHTPSKASDRTAEWSCYHWWQTLPLAQGEVICPALEDGVA